MRFYLFMGEIETALGNHSALPNPVTGAAIGLGRWFLRVAVFPICGDFQRRRQHRATTAHRALPVCEWPALGMPWGTATSNAASAMWSRGGGACTGGCGRAGKVVCGGCGFAGMWRCPQEKEALGNYSAYNPVSVSVAIPGHATGHCKLKCSLCRLK